MLLPRDQRAVKTAADTMRPNPAIDTVKTITELGVGEALVSFLDDRGTPAMVERAWVLPPASRIGPATDAERAAVIAGSVLAGHYEHAVDRESAYETLKARAERRSAPAGDSAPAPSAPRTPSGPFAQPAPSPAPKTGGMLNDLLFGTTGPRGGHHEGILGSAARSAARSVGSGMGRQILRGVLGSIFGGRR